MDSFRAQDGRQSTPPIHRVLQDSSIYFLGNVASRVVGFLAIPFYARFLSPAQYGLIELIELSTQTIAIALGLQAIGAALSRLFYDQRSRDAEQAVVSTSLIATALLSATVTLVAVAGAGHLSQLVFHSDEWTSLLRAAFIAMFFSNMMEVVLVYERIRNNARFFLQYTLTTLALNLALNILFIGGLDAGVWGFVSSKLVVTSFGSLFLLLRIRRDVGWHWRTLYVPELVRFGAPLVLSSLSYFAIHFSDRFFLGASVSLAELGRYALAYKFAILVSALVGDSFAKSWEATLYRYTDTAGWPAQFARVASYFTFILFVTGLGIALFSPELMRIMVPKDYFPPPFLLPILIASYLAREIGDFFRSLLLINKRSVTVSQIALGGALLNLAANMALIPRLGIYGAAIATLVTWFVYMLICWVIANREHRLPVRVFAYVRITLLVAAVFGCAAATRVPPLLPQLIMDGFWLLVFAALATGLFFSAAERQGALGMLGTLSLWAIARTNGARPTEGVGAGQGGTKFRMTMLAYYYPPQNEIGAARPGRLARWLRRAGVDVSVITSAVAAGPGTLADSGPPGTTLPEIRVVHVPRVGLRRSATSLSPSLPSVRAGAALLHIGERLLLPYDDRLGWLSGAHAAAAETLHPDTVLFSTSPPTVTHLTALALKRRYGHPWIADFRDPLWGSPHRTSQRAAIVDPMIERLIVKHADAIIANTQAAADVLRSRYPARHEDIYIIWNGYDPDDIITPLAQPTRTRRTLTHVGTLYGDRTLLPILGSLDRLIQCGRLDPETIEVRQVGRADPANHDRTHPLIWSMVGQGCLSMILENVPQPQARAEMCASNWLLLLDMNIVNPGLQVPAKLYEYIRTGRPILALSPPGSSTAHILAEAGIPHLCLDVFAEPPAFDEALVGFLARAMAPCAPSETFIRDFAAPSQAGQLLEIVTKLIAGREARADS